MTWFGKKTSSTTSKAERFLAVCDSGSGLFEIPEDRKFNRDSRRSIKADLASITASPYQNYDHSRLFHILDAFARLLVSQPSGESIAVAFLPTQDGRLTIYLAHNGSNDGLGAAEVHLRDIWSILQRIRASLSSASDESKTTPSDINPSRIAAEFCSKCYTHSAARLRWYYGRAMKADMLNVLKNAAAYREAQLAESLQPVNKGDRLPVATHAEGLSEAHWEFISALIKALETYEKYNSDDRESKKHMMKSFVDANGILRQLPGHTHFLNYILPFFASKAPYNVVGGTKWQRLADKLLSLDASIRQLLGLPKSNSLGYTLDSKGSLVIKCAPAQTKKLVFDFRTDKDVIALMKIPERISHTAFVKQLEDKNGEKTARSDELAVHAECSLLAHLVDNNVKAYNYIGVSNLCCVGCWLFFKQYDRFARSRLLNPFYVRGSDSKVCPWVAPTSRLTKDILQAMEDDVETFYLGLLQHGYPGETHDFLLPEW